MRHDLIKEIYKTRTFVINIAYTIVVYRPRHFTMHPLPPAPSRPTFFDSENCCWSENRMPPKFCWDMKDHRKLVSTRTVF